METSASLNQLGKQELVERCLRLKEKLEKQETASTSWIEALTTIALTDQDITQSMTKGLQLMLQTSGMNGGYIHLLDEKDHLLKLRACLGLSKRAQEDLSIIREGEKVPGQVLEKAEALIARRVTEISDLSGKVTEGKKRMLHAGFPLKWNGRVLGTLTLVSRNHRTLSDRDGAVLKAFSQFLAMVVQNLTLFDIVSQGKQQWENAIDSVSDLVVVCDGSFRITRANKAILDRFWLPLENAIGKECFEVLYDGTPLPVSREKLENLLTEGVTYSEEVVSSRWDGVFSILVSPILAFGRLAGSIHVIREITQEKILEKDRDELDRKISLFAPGTIMIDPTGKIRSYDSGAHEILGYKEKEMKGKPLSLVFPSAETEVLFDRLEENGGVLDFDSVAISKEKRHIPVSLTLSAHRNQKEELEDVTIFLRDMTHQQTKGMRLSQSLRLTAMMETAANVSRKLGERLEAIIDHIDKIKEGAHDTHEISKRLERVFVHGRSIQEVLDQLQQFSEVRSEEEPRRLESAELVRALVEMVEQKWGDLLRSRDIVFALNPDQRNLPSARGDVAELLKAFDHLVRNAVEAMPLGGKLILRTRTDRKWVSLILIDHGRGMEPEEIDRAFEPFFTTHSQNLGLGLTIVYGIVRKHHGKVTLQSDPPQGTRVTIRLPTIAER